MANEERLDSLKKEIEGTVKKVTGDGEPNQESLFKKIEEKLKKDEKSDTESANDGH